VVFGEIPDLWALAGMALIVASGLYTIHRERMIRRRRAAC
jgi:drug/metabolite transporter (DMT)-like permease